jgi:hypothetical protein
MSAAIEQIADLDLSHEQDWRTRALSSLAAANNAISHGLTEQARAHIGEAAQAIIDDFLDGDETE